MASELHQKGERVRREVLGDGHVNAAQARAADEFSGPMAALSTEFCWGALWGRDELPRRTRSLVNLAILTALNRGEEFKLHLRGALRNGCTREEIREVLLQTAVYCGIPAGSTAFRLAREVFAEDKQDAPK